MHSITNQIAYIGQQNILMKIIAEKVKKFERIYFVQSNNNSHFEETTNETLSKICTI